MQKYIKLIPIIIFPYLITLMLINLFGNILIINYNSINFLIRDAEPFKLLSIVFLSFFVRIFGVFIGIPISEGLESIFDYGNLLLLILLFLLGITAIICSIIVVTVKLIKKHDSQEILRINMIIRLIQFPVNIVIFFTIISMILFISTGTIALGIILFSGITCFTTGLIGLCGLIRGLCEKKLAKISAVVFGIFQFVFCLDIICSVIAYRKVKNVNKREFINLSSPCSGL